MAASENLPKNKIVFYVDWDSIPNQELKRIQYYFQDPSSDSKNPSFIGQYATNTMGSFTKETLDSWIVNNQIIELPQPLSLDSVNDLWLGSDGHLYTGYGWAPWENKTLVLKDFLSYKK